MSLKVSQAGKEIKVGTAPCDVKCKSYAASTSTFFSPERSEFHSLFGACRVHVLNTFVDFFFRVNERNSSCEEETFALLRRFYACRV